MDRGISRLEEDKLLREHLVALLKEEHAHINFSSAIRDLPFDLLGKRTDMLERLWENRNRLVTALREEGYHAESETPIIPLRVGCIDKTVDASAYLYERGIYVPAIRPPTVKEPRLRITITAGHSAEEIDALVSALSGMRR